MAVSITGHKKLDRALQSLPSRVSKKVLRQAMRKGMKIIQSEAKKIAPVDTGEFRDSIKVRSGPRSRRGITMDVVAMGDNNFTPKFLEFGTSNMEAQPTFRPTFDSHGPRARELVVQEIAAGIERESSK